MGAKRPGPAKRGPSVHTYADNLEAPVMAGLSGGERRKVWFREQLKAAFPPVKLSRNGWKMEYAAKLEEVAMTELPRGKMRRRMKAKAVAIRLCGSAVDVLTCLTPGCGKQMPGTGIMCSPGKPCNARGCDYCARARATQQRHWARAAMAYVLEHGDPSGSFKALTITTQRDPKDPEAHTVQALKERERLVWLQATKMVEVIRKASKAAGWKSDIAFACSVETGPTGHVHGHVLSYMPFVPIKHLNEQLAKVPGPTGHAHIERIGDKGQRSLTPEQMSSAIVE